ncbi:hypothetical protein [Celeribacter baekdonensis]|uniref:hypothetical protein n=1 Tax=Celeribacter baekdonensis TaxID=875171 RepID=UPI003A8F6F93
MGEITQDQLERLHRAGVALSNSWLTYAHPDLKTEWQDLQKHSPIEALQKDALAASELDGDMTAKLTHAFSGFGKLTGARSDLKNKLQANTLSYVSGGHLHGFGYELPRTVSAVPVAIPKAAWAGKCDWTNGTVSFRGLEFVDVRLTTNRIRNEILERGVVDKTPTSPAGRPGVGPAIEDAFRSLHKTGQIDASASQASHYPKVRAWLELNKPDLPVPPAHLSDKTIYKYFSPLFKDL